MSFSTGRFASAFAVLALSAAGVPAAFAALERVGPTSTSNGYPAWYQDKSGLTLEFCQPQNATELIGGWCLLLPADVPAGAPEVFPTNFSEEHFYWAANALVDFPSGGVTGTGRAVLVLAIEGAFGAGPVTPGDQVTFGRVRVDIRNLPASGTYTIQHPYGTWTFPNQVAGDRLFFTEDIGICGPGQFDCALLTSVGPFLLPSNLPGGAELPPVPGPSGLYIADPARLGPVTGSPAGQNFFRIIGPGGIVIAETSNFSLMGRVFTGNVPGRVEVTRASYTQSATAKKVDVFATAFETTQPRLPGGAKPPAVIPALTYFNAPCVASATGVQSAPAGQVEVQMFGAGKDYWGQSQPATIPPEVCVQDKSSRNAAGQVVPTFFRRTVADEVSIAAATYDPANGGRLSVTGVASSDTVNAVTLKLGGVTPLVGGSVTVTPLAAPPETIQVVSSRGGVAELPVRTGVASGTVVGPTPPVALNDSVSTNEDSPATFNVLANDTVNGSPIVFGPGVTVTIVSAPRLGGAAVNATTGAITFIPSANASGADALSYTVTVGTSVSGVATVSINIVPVNDAPRAVNDSLSSAVNAVTNINVLSNDTDPDGAADLANAVIITQPAAGATVTGGAGGVVAFTATTAGTFTFTYQAQDRAGVLSNTATVTVTVTSAETITVSLAEYRTDQSRFRVSGSDNVSGGQTLSIAYDNGTAAGTVIGTAPVVAGSWILDIGGATGILDPRTTGATRLRITSPLGGVTIFNITVRR